ncbi:hypothetical protein [Vibrio mytili]|uniref:Uncharacterized protein n=1 Tax=Vibrio mytili TaxID=50718 RepID=A0A0C3EDA8_9VIBR|nr:hypothetical protein [Vibrio mytili]KIN12453.1 hypothetical protein SU60_01315 [Vibrio mytili]
MRLKSLHTIWLTLLTTLVFLVSSVVNSASLMSVNMMSNSTSMSTHAMVSTQKIVNTQRMVTTEHCGSRAMEVVVDTHASHSPDQASLSLSENALAENVMADCVDNTGSIHNCCSASCSAMFVYLPTPSNHTLPQAYRAPMLFDTSAPVVQVNNNLYRPPIV